jgi:hypothetical protein
MLRKRPDRCKVGTDRAAAAAGFANRTTAQDQSSRGGECDLVHGLDRLSVASVAEEFFDPYSTVLCHELVICTN